MDWPTQSECIDFYGNPLDTSWYEQNIVFVHPAFEMRYENKPVGKIAIHRRCAASFVSILQSVWHGCNQDQSEINRLGISNFCGAYNYRPMRGIQLLSMHAFGAAIDFDAENNPASFGGAPSGFTPDHVLVRAFENEGWIWGGRWRGRCDPMHFQAARVK